MAIGIEVNTPMGLVVGSISFQPMGFAGGVTVTIETQKAPLVGAICAKTVLSQDEAETLLAELQASIVPPEITVEDGPLFLDEEEEPDL